MHLIFSNMPNEFVEKNHSKTAHCALWISARFIMSIYRVAVIFDLLEA